MVNPKNRTSNVRNVLHADLDTFFVSVERLIDPRLKGRPVVIGGQPDARGVVAACSYEARTFGVSSGMALRLAYRKCPGAVFLPVNGDAYRTYSHKVATLLKEAAPVVEQASVDEFYLDLSGCEPALGNLYQWSARIKTEVNGALRLPISMGLAANKLVAKMATSAFKGRQAGGHLASVLHGEEAAFLAPFSVERLPGIGPVTADTLRRLGLFRLGEVQQVPESVLTAALGLQGLKLARRARGIDESPVAPERIALSVGHEHTFREDTLDPDQLFPKLRHLAAKTGFDLRRQQQCAARLVFKLRYADFKTTTRTQRLASPTNDDAVLFDAARAAFHALFTRRVRIRLIGIRAEGLMPSVAQYDLYEDTSQRRQQLWKAVDQLKTRYGFGIIVHGSWFMVRGS